MMTKIDGNPEAYSELSHGKIKQQNQTTNQKIWVLLSSSLNREVKLPSEHIRGIFFTNSVPLDWTSQGLIGFQLI